MEAAKRSVLNFECRCENELTPYWNDKAINRKPVADQSIRITWWCPTLTTFHQWSDQGKKKKGSDCNRLFWDPENKLLRVLRVTHSSLWRPIHQQEVNLRDFRIAVTHWMDLQQNVSCRTKDLEAENLPKSPSSDHPRASCKPGWHLWNRRRRRRL